MAQNCNICLLCLALAGVLHLGQAEYFSSVDKLQTLGVVEAQLLKAAREYLQAQRSKHEKYASYINQIKAQHQLAIKDLPEYLGNPLNSLQLINRLINDWSPLQESLLEDKPKIELNEKLNAITDQYGLPDENDLNGVAKSLARLQEVYDLETADLAAGDLYGEYTGTGLDWRDCYEVATQLFEAKLYKACISWFEQAIELLQGAEDADADTSYMVDIYEYLAMAHNELGHTSLVNLYTDELLTHASEQQAINIKTYVDTTPATYAPTAPFDWFSNYTRLCQGIQVADQALSRLHCYLDARRHTYFTLAPLQVEQISADPEINLYHGLLNDVQIEDILSEAHKKGMFRSGVLADENGNSKIDDVRVSQQTWLTYESPVMRTVHNLVSHTTNLDLGNAEQMQTANYGIGGQYNPHYDFFADRLPAHLKGDRIATCMFYLSEPEMGGYTVFPKMNTYLQPVKGALVVWYNLHKSVDGDYRTQHAGCPVLKGTKRISNVWIHAEMQEFRRPCALQRDVYNDAFYKNNNTRYIKK